MQDILRTLYRGQVRPCEQRCSHNAEVVVARRRLVELERSFCSGLDAEQKLAYDELTACSLDESFRVEEAAFVDGFSLAFRLVVTSLSD